MSRRNAAADVPAADTAAAPVRRDGKVPRVRIVVLVKHVPDIQSERTIGPDGRVVRDGGDGTLTDTVFAPEQDAASMLRILGY